jgi:hypothetical protein
MGRLGKVVLVAVLTTGIYVPTVAEQVAHATCGVWRWPVKTLSDPDRHQVDFDPIGTQVKFLRQRDRPAITIGTSTPRTSRTEFHAWKIKARPIQAKLEDDSDIHLVIAVPHHPAKTMIVEFPKKTCVASSFKRWKIAHARQQFLNNCGSVSSSSWLHLAGRITLVGVGFWDEKHGQTGIAPNGIELHPVLNLKGDCHRASTGGGGGGGGNCDPSYPTICIPPPPPDLDCSEIPYTNFKVVAPDDHHLDGDGDGIGCET